MGIALCVIMFGILLSMAILLVLMGLFGKSEIHKATTPTKRNPARSGSAHDKET